jgi:DNA-binding transcriptional ArsR family regulator
MTRQLARSTSWVVAHPLRFRIMEVLREAPSTSAHISQRLGESRGSISYHLRQLAAVGAIVEAPELGTRRERWWRRDAELVVFPNDPDGEGRAISSRWAALLFARDEEVKHSFVTGDVPDEWRDAVAVGNWFVRMTPEEAAELGVRLYALVHEIRSRAEPPPGAADAFVSVSVLPVVSPTKAT